MVIKFLEMLEIILNNFSDIIPLVMLKIQAY